MSAIVKIGKLGKRVLKKFISQAEVHTVCYTRRIEKVKTDRRIVAMTFDDGPMDIPASPDLFGGKSLTDVLLDTLAKHNAKGTFDVIGTTADNYPDSAGSIGSASWGGIKYDHYPDINKDDKGGAVNNARLIGRMIDEGHQITNHGYNHIIFGKKPFVYGKRKYLGSFDSALGDISKLHSLMKEKYSYEMKMGRPPHYVDKIENSLSSYDVYEAMGYQYLAADFDGAGWLPSTLPDEKEAYNAEVNAMVSPLKAALENNPDSLCGCIIFQKDGYNMAKRTPVASGLEKQLEILDSYGYKVVTVEELLSESPFADVGRDDPDFGLFESLVSTRAIAYSDNTLRPDNYMSWGELAMFLAPKKELLELRVKEARTDKKSTRYSAAIQICSRLGYIPSGVDIGARVDYLPPELFEPVEEYTRRNVYKSFIGGSISENGNNN